MPVTFEELQRLIHGEKMRAFSDPSLCAALLMVNMPNGTYTVSIFVQENNAFLQFATCNYLNCPAHHPNLFALLQTLADINAMFKLTRFGWRRQSGEVAAYMDFVVADARVTQEQFGTSFARFLQELDMVYPRLQAVLQTGKDPGPPEMAAAPVAAGPAMI